MKLVENSISKINENRVVVLFMLLFLYAGFLLFGLRLPLALVFGPVLLFVISSKRVSSLSFLLHLLPFLIFLSIKLYLMYGKHSFEEFENVFYIFYNSASVISITAYMFYVIRKRCANNFSWYKRFYIRQLYFSYVITIGAFLVYLIRRIFRPEENVYGIISIVLTVISLMFVFSIVYVVVNFKEKKRIASGTVNKLGNEQVRYGLRNQDLEEFAEKIKEYFDTSKDFLDVNFNLDKLASHLQIPKHHLSVCFTNHFRMNFYNLLAIYRIKEAIKLAETASIYTWESIAFDCGYSSRSTFNKHFREITGCLPSEFSKEKSSKIHTL